MKSHIAINPPEMGFLRILIVDDEANIRKTLSLCLESRGHKVTAVSNAEDAKAQIESHAFDMAFVDLRLGALSGLDLIPRLLVAAPWLKIVVITAYASVDTAVEAMRRGAIDYIPKPFKPDHIRRVLAVTKSLQEAANILGIDQATLWRKRKAYQI